MPFSDELLKVRRGGIAPVPPAPPKGMIFPSNATSGSDIRIVFSGSIMPSRTQHTVLWKSNYTDQNGYYADTWHSHNDGTFHSDTYEYGCHPYPTALSTPPDANGQNTDVTSQGGNIHYYEVAGLGGHDYLCSPGGTPVLVSKGSWYSHARTCEVISGTTLRHSFYVDVDGNPSQVIVQDILLGDLAAAGSTPAFYYGCSDWRSGQPTTGQNDETPAGIMRGLAIFSSVLSITDIAAIHACPDDASVLSYCSGAGITSLWYLNFNPTPSDINDKSGNARHPSWANANRPTAWP